MGWIFPLLDRSPLPPAISPLLSHLPTFPPPPSPLQSHTVFDSAAFLSHSHPPHSPPAPIHSLSCCPMDWTGAVLPHWTPLLTWCDAAMLISPLPWLACWTV